METSKKIKIKEIPHEEPSMRSSAIEQSQELASGKAVGELAVDMYETDKEVVIQSPIAGVKPEDIDISIEDDMVTIRGERKNSFEEKQKNYFYQECYWGSFERRILLPEGADIGKAEAIMKDGILTVRIPKRETPKEKKVQVK